MCKPGPEPLGGGTNDEFFDALYGLGASDVEGNDDAEESTIVSSSRSTRRKSAKKGSSAKPASKSTGSSRKGSKSSKASRPPASSAAPHAKAGRTKRTLPQPEPDAEAEEDQNRSQFLERNRQAASKCRRKKKEWITDLEEARSELEITHSQLTTERSGLVSEVSMMKHQLMSHAGCNDQNIDNWIENEARRFVHQGRSRPDQLYGGDGGPGQGGSMVGAAYPSPAYQDSGYGMEHFPLTPDLPRRPS